MQSTSKIDLYQFELDSLMATIKFPGCCSYVNGQGSSNL